MEEEDLLRFMKKEEVDNVFPLFEGAVESGKIKRKSLKNWLVSSLANYFPAPSMTPSYYPFKKKKKLYSNVVSSCHDFPSHSTLLWLFEGQ